MLNAAQQRFLETELKQIYILAMTDLTNEQIEQVKEDIKLNLAQPLMIVGIPESNYPSISALLDIYKEDEQHPIVRKIKLLGADTKKGDIRKEISIFFDLNPRPSSLTPQSELCESPVPMDQPIKFIPWRARVDALKDKSDSTPRAHKRQADEGTALPTKVNKTVSRTAWTVVKPAESGGVLGNGFSFKMFQGKPNGVRKEHIPVGSVLPGQHK